jgi:hypothetical protein
MSGMREKVEELSELAAECAAAPVWQLGDDDLETFLVTMHRVQQLARAAVLHAVREVEGRGLPKAQHSAATNVWLRGRLRISASAAGRLLRQARLLDADTELDTAVSRGDVNEEQLGAIDAALGDLPHDTDAEVRSQARAALVDWSRELDPVDLRRLGGRILAHVAPEAHEAAEESRLRAAERAARDQRYLAVVPLGDGRVRLRGMLDTQAAAVVTAALDPLCRPDVAMREQSEEGATRTPGQRRADALVEVCRLSLAGGELPDNGGDRPQLSITASYDVLSQQLGHGVTDEGAPVSAEVVRKLACDARLTPYVLGGDSQILDAGRARRLVTAPIRRALAVRDGGCTFPGCDRPSRWCDAHHVVAWTDGGPTDLSNLALLCDYHHQVVHEEGGWRARMSADGQPEFIPPTWIDPEQLPRRNRFHRRT